MAQQMRKIVAQDTIASRVKYLCEFATKCGLSAQDFITDPNPFLRDAAARLTSKRRLHLRK